MVWKEMRQKVQHKGDREEEGAIEEFKLCLIMESRK